MSEPTAGPRTLTIDIGGTGLKMITLDAFGNAEGERDRELTPRPATPDAVVATLRQMIGRQRPFDRVSVGFPGVVAGGVVRTAANLGTDVRGQRMNFNGFVGVWHGYLTCVALMATPIVLPSLARLSNSTRYHECLFCD